MKKSICVQLAAALFAIPVCAAADSELDTLRAENAALKAQLHQLQTSCPAATSATSMSPASTPTPAIPASASAPPTIAPPPAPPPGYKLVPVAPPNSETGCSIGLFKSGPDAPWKHSENWDSLHRGMTPTAVEGYLGAEHFNFESKGLEAWQFGKCGKNFQGQVVFKAGEVLFWVPPDF